MPLVAHTPLPSFDRLRRRGQEVLTLSRALSQDIRELHIGLLNMMPDSALEITERQFMRLVGNSNQIAQFYVHPFSVPGLQRSAETQAYIDQYYTTFEQVKAGRSGRADHHRRQRRQSQPGSRRLLAATDRGHRMGAPACHLDHLLLPCRRTR